MQARRNNLGRNRRGFTLTEIAIVLGVVGLVIAAIFTASSIARYRIEINQGADEVNLIAGNMRALYAGQNVSAIATTAFSAALEQKLAAQQVFPTEMNCIQAGITYGCHPWDLTTASGSAQIQLCKAGDATCTVAGYNAAQFTVRYVRIPAEVCTDLLVHTSLPGTDTGLIQIVVTGAAAPTTFTYSPSLARYQLPVTPIQAANACPFGANGAAGTFYTIDWFYTLGS